MDKPKIAVAAGGAQGIGRVICDAFVKQGVSVNQIQRIIVTTYGGSDEM